MDGLEDIFLADLGLEAQEPKRQEGVSMDYLPVSMQDRELARRQMPAPVTHTSHALSASEKRILGKTQELARRQEGLGALTDHGLAVIGEVARHAHARFYEDTEVMLAVKNAAKSQEHRDIMEKETEALIHYIANGQQHIINQTTKMVAEDLAETNKELRAASADKTLLERLGRRYGR